MPFTPSHVAAVLPLARSPLVPSALVLGSMAPDVPYYLPVTMRGAITHTALATVGVDVLLGLALYLLWHGVLAGPALAAAPSGLVVRVPAVPRFGERVRSIRLIALTALSCSLGSMTHVGWDEFTHGGRWGTQHLAWLAEMHGPLAGFRWAQYASGLIGALVVVGWLVRWWHATEPWRPAPDRPRWMLPAVWAVVLGAGILSAAVASGILGGRGPLAEPGGPGLAAAGFLGATRGALAAVVIAVLLACGWHLRRWHAFSARSDPR